MKNFIYGVQFYRPPNPPRKQRKRDLENIKKLGFNIIKIWAMWNWINYAEDKYDFSEIEEIIKFTRDLNIDVIINTSLENCPYWLADKYPDSYYLSANNKKIELMARPNAPTGGWPGLCFDNTKVRDEAELFLKELIINLDSYENVKFWDCWNEPHMEPTSYRFNDLSDNLFCYCKYTIDKYRSWLKMKYKNIDKLNKAWFKRYRSFEDIEPPRKVNSYVDMMEWRKFINANMVNHMNWRVNTIKKYLQKDSKIISHSSCQGLTSGFSIFACSDYEMAKNVSIYGLSAFPFWANLTLYEYSLLIETTISMAKDKEIWLEELQGGPTMPVPSGLTRSKIPYSIQGREIAHKDIELVSQLINTNPSWGRTRLSRAMQTMELE